MSGLPASFDKPLGFRDLSMFEQLFKQQAWKPIDERLRDAIVDALTVCFFDTKLPWRTRFKALQLLQKCQQLNISLTEQVIAALEASQPKLPSGLPAKELSPAERIAHVDRIIEEGIASGRFEDDEKPQAEGVAGAEDPARGGKRRRK